MQRIKLTISYDGTNFNGYQVQPNERTVQSELEKVLEQIHKGKTVKVTASGRTDRFVHAVGQVVHFDTDLSIPPEKWSRALNSLLPDDILVREAEWVANDFHARFDAVRKEYRYKLNRGPLPDLFKRNFEYHYPYPLDIEKMRKAAAHLLGTHDFSSFSSAKSEVEDRIRTIYTIEVIEIEDEVIFQFIGNGFLYNMVRILVGTLLEVGIGKREPDSMHQLLEGKDRRLAGKTAPGHGLYLWRVEY
ncbi:MAG TPA: tRNA pseudouridine(38-40) synthase TruA [Bacillus sp. (in: firmicutes)]|uniref:tRNA pseudouridine(38-40) synthase TruA n=1 Tax=Bacillus litorisediminis TaxID=2922713 RepID=UPI001FAB4B50|nr:tRNA pseudouridine(38-40) synthase TruA [Bacillus litorisediminis]HWO78627.1 tRNA pseudouridine(38-40) synthase TruA [Bacillus sp. (in: firmicutes)]